MTTILPPEPVRRVLRQCEDKRIGRRMATSDLTMAWRPPVVAKQAWLGRGRRAGPAETAEVVDLSVSGAKVLVAGTHRVPVGSKVHIGLDGATGTAIVRRTEPGPPGRLAYGIQFLTLDPVLAERIAALLTGTRGHLEARWASAW